MGVEPLAKECFSGVRAPSNRVQYWRRGPFELKFVQDTVDVIFKELLTDLGT